MKTRKIVVLALLASLAIGLNLIDSFVSSAFPIGVRLGVANLVIIVALYLYGAREALIITILKFLIASLIRGNIFSITFFMAMAGSLSSLTVMIVLKRLKFNIISIGVSGGLMHMIMQIVVLALYSSNAYVFYYLPVLLISSLISSVILAIIANTIIKRFSKATSQR